MTDNSASNTTTRVFDSVGRVTSVQDDLGNISTSRYDLVGHVNLTTDARGNQTTYVYSYQRLSSFSTPTMAISYYFDARNNHTTVNAPNSTTTFTYDANNRVLTEKNKLGNTWTYTYNGDGTKATKLDPNGKTTTYGYDVNKRLTSVTFADTTQLTFTYDSRGHRLTEVSPDLNRSMTYDTLGRLATVTDNTLNKTLTYGYDAAGNRTSVTYDGLTLNYTYDADRRLTQILDPDGEATGFTYDPGGRRTSLVQGNGVLTTTAYDGSNRLTSITSPIQSFGYTYDALGNPATKTFTDGTQEIYSYDASSRLTNVISRAGDNGRHVLAAEGYRNSFLFTSFDGDLNKEQSDTYTINGFDQVTADSHSVGIAGTAYTYAYDNNGNRSTFTLQDNHTTPKPPAVVTTYTWNQDDRLSKITYQGGATNTLAYDANGIRVGKSDSSGNVRYLIDPTTQSILATYDAVTKVRLTTYTQNPQKVDEIVSYKTSGGSKYYPHTDMLGSVYAVSDSTGKAVATWTYDVYGTRTQTGGSLSYPGEPEWEPEW